MYHVRFKGSYYEAGFKFGKNVLKSGKKLDHCPTFPLTKETYAFAKECEKEYRKYYPEESESFVAAANCFHSKEMQPYCNTTVDDWRAEERYETAYQALKGHQKLYSVEYAESILAGEHGFMCQYDRKTNADTVWSVVYDLKRKRIYRVEGNPSRKPFKEDDRMKLSYA